MESPVTVSVKFCVFEIRDIHFLGICFLFCNMLLLVCEHKLYTCDVNFLSLNLLHECLKTMAWVSHWLGPLGLAHPQST